MATRLVSLTFDAQDAPRLGRFWADALGWTLDDSGDDVYVRPTDGTPFDIVVVPVDGPKTGKNPIHVDLVAESVEDQRAVVDRLVGLGATPADVGQGEVDWVVLADPEGDELCVVVRGEFLADTGFFGSIVFEPAHPATGRFWSEAIGWPVVYDEDGDIALRAPDGRGPFVTFGPPGTAEHGKNRVHLDLAPEPGEDHAAAVERLLALGATRADIGQGDTPWVVLADPDGNELCLLTPQ